MELYQKANPEDNRKAQEYFKAATIIDPGYVAAWVKLAQTHLLDGFFGTSTSPSESYNRAFGLFKKALKLDEQDENAHAALGNFYLVISRQHEKAISEGKRAVLLNPNFADGHASLAMTKMYSGDFAEAVTLMKKALRLNPNAQPMFLFTPAESYIFLGRCEEAL